MTQNVRRYDTIQNELNGIPYEAVSTAKTGSFATSFSLVTAFSGGPPPTGSFTTTFSLVTAFSGGPPPTGSFATSFTLVSAFSGGPPARTGSFSTTFTLVAPFTASDQIGLLATETTLFPDRVGVTVGSPPSSSHTVIAGVSSRPVGSNPVLTGNYAFRGLYSFDTSIDTPGDFQVDGRGWVTLASWGDFQFRLRRDLHNVYRVRADFITAGATPVHAAGQITIADDDPRSFGLGATRDATTGAIRLWLSEDGWVSWMEIPAADKVEVAGALPDSIPDGLVVLGGDLQDGPWISVFAAQWAATTDITALDADEVAAWNYGSNIVTGLGGDFYDTFDNAVKDAWEFGANSSYVHSQRTETTDGGTTRRVDFTFNAPTLNTAVPPAGTETAFTLDLTPQWEQGPPVSVWAPPILFDSHSQFTVNRLRQTVRDPDGTGARYRVLIVDIDGTVLHALDHAAVQKITWSLDEVEAFDFIMPALDPLTAQITTGDTEVQIWRGSELLIWGVVVRALEPDAEIEYQCRGLGWYFTKRFVGGPRRNFLGNPSFEGNLDWFHNQFAPTEPTANRNPANWSWELSSARSLTGFPGRSLRLASNDVMDFGVSSIQFVFHEIDADEWPDGIQWTAAAWAYIPSSDWQGERNAAYNWGGESAPFGLHLGRFSTTESQEQNLVNAAFPKVHELVVAGLTDDLPRDQWVRLEVSLTQPAPEGGGKRTDWIQVELHAPIGTVYWDEISLTRNERLFFNEVPQEQIMTALVAHAQDTQYGKSNLNITAPAVPFSPPGPKRTRTYEFFNRDLISDLIEEFTSLWGGCDWSIETTATTRTFVPWYPMKGTRRPAQALRTGKNVASLSKADDGEQRASRVVVRSDLGGTGSSREEVMATDTTGFKGGLVLEEAINATKESPLDSLTDQVEQALRQKRSALIPTITTHENLGPSLLTKIQTGDVVPVQATDAGLTLDGDFRIVAITLNPSDETLDITVNPFGDHNDPVA